MPAHETGNGVTATVTPTSQTPLDATVVRYRNDQDRCTVAPTDVDDEQRLTAWLSVDADALVRLGEMR